MMRAFISTFYWMWGKPNPGLLRFNLYNTGYIVYMFILDYTD